MPNEIHKDYNRDRKAKRPASLVKSSARFVDSEAHADRVIGKDKKTMGKAATKVVKRKIVERDMEAKRKKRTTAAKKKKPADKKKSATKKRSY